MNIIPNETFHIYNQGNNQETIIYEDSDYLEFLQLFRRFVFPHCKVLAYCLMPNHFHFLIHTIEDSAKIKLIDNINLSELPMDPGCYKAIMLYISIKKINVAALYSGKKQKLNHWLMVTNIMDPLHFNTSIRIHLKQGWLQDGELGLFILC